MKKLEQVASLQIHEAQGEDGENLLHNSEENVLFRRVGQDGGRAHASRMTPGAHVAAHDRTASVSLMHDREGSDERQELEIRRQ